MKRSIKPLGVSALLLTLAGCADFQLPQLPTLPLPAPPETQTAPVVKEIPEIKDSIEKVCDTALDNSLRAKELYHHKKLTSLATFHAIEPSGMKFFHKWRGHPRGIQIIGRAKKESQHLVSQLSRAKTYKISGMAGAIGAELSGVSILPDVCTILLYDIDFPE